MEYTKSYLSKEQSNPLLGNSAELAAQRVKEALPPKRVDHISSYLLERIAQTLHVPAADLDEFAQLGRDLGVGFINLCRNPTLGSK